MSEIVERTVKVNGTHLHMRVEGRADGQVLAFVNSLATDHRMWDRQASALAAEFRVLRYDARGHGRSAAPSAPYTMDMLVDDLLGMLAEAGASRAHVIGLSLGGLTAIAAALRHPPQIASIVACDCRADTPPEFARGIDERNRLVREKGVGAIAEAMVQRWFTPSTLAAHPSELDVVRDMIRSTSVEGFVGCAEAIRGSSLRLRVRDIRLPALFVVGSEDAALPVEMMRGMQSEVAASDLAVIPQAGHLANVERPDAFNLALIKFLRKQA